jgi:predicted Fe-S protein YdhL (DUF1289 family)
MFKRVKTPCVGVCSTTICGDVCRGCKRFSHEVIDWNTYTNEQRYLIASRLEGFLAQVVKHKLAVVDVDKLLKAIKYQQIQFNSDQNPYCWVFDLLRAGSSQIDDLSTYGLRRQSGWEQQSLTEIQEAIDADFYTLSSAHYDRYVKPEINHMASIKETAL